MNVLTLMVGVALPWAAGYAWLLCASERGGRRPHLALAAGYGFFLGHALLYFLARATSALTGNVSFGVVALTLALIAGAGAALRVRINASRVRRRRAPWSADLPSGTWPRLLLLVLVAWMLAHLAFSALEVITNPVFPWDAWTVWVYRAKAWFLSGHMVEFLTVPEWLRSGPGIAYTVPGTDYPLLPSVPPYWAALSLGDWHEALVNLPVWFCGLAIVAGFYGQSRSLGLAVLPAAALGYLLVSTPLFGTHISLAGYADIWQAGYAGLGLVALLRGLAERLHGQVLLGLACVALGLLVKDEGVVWLVAALLLAATMTIPPRVQVIAWGLAILLLSGLALFDITHVELPLIGLVGLEEGRLHVPFADAYVLEVHDVRLAYLRNAFMLGNWHLAWVLLIAGLAVALARPLDRRCRAALVFLVTFIASQVAIFVFSSEGAWAEDYTAINRLPLQVYPALLFALALVFRSVTTGYEEVRLAAAGPINAVLPARALIVFALAGVVTVAGAWLWLRMENDDPLVEPLVFEPTALRPMVGTGREAEGRLVVDGYRNGIVLLSSGPVRIDSRRHYLLRLALDFDPGLAWPDEAPAFFWRSGIHPESVSRVTLDGASLVDLSISEDWRGEITEVGLLFPQHDGRPAELGGVALEGRSLWASIELLPKQWFEFERWTQKSAHSLYGGAPEQQLSLSLLMVAWVSLALMILAALPRAKVGRRAATAALILLAGWFTLDVRWTADRVRQFRMSMNELTHKNVEERIGSSELGKFYPFVREIRSAAIAEGPARVMLILDPAEHKYYAWRSKYQLLPHAVVIQPRLGKAAMTADLDYVLFLGDFAGDGDPVLASRDRLDRLPIPHSWVDRLELVDLRAEGALFRIRK